MLEQNDQKLIFLARQGNKAAFGNHLKRHKVICFSLETMVQTLTDDLLASSSTSPQQIVEREELRATVLDAVDELSDKNRLATLLFYEQQLSLQEVADHLNISVGAVKGRLHKSRHQLKEKLSLLQPQSAVNLENKTMSTSHNAQRPTKFFCSFCGKSQAEVNLLIAGSALDATPAYICNECIDICNQIVSHHTDSDGISTSKASG